MIIENPQNESDYNRNLRQYGVCVWGGFPHTQIPGFLLACRVVLPAYLTVLPQTQEAVGGVRDDIAALQIQDAGAEVGLVLQGLLAPLLQLGVVAVEVDVADEVRGTVQGAKATLLPQTGEFFICRKEGSGGRERCSFYALQSGRMPVSDQAARSSFGQRRHLLTTQSEPGTREERSIEIPRP